ncbi:hypothetical protein H1R20_g13062, partial [Candolleomyces eurysporus]
MRPIGRQRRHDIQPGFAILAIHAVGAVVAGLKIAPATSASLKLSYRSTTGKHVCPVVAPSLRRSRDVRRHPQGP